MAGSSTADLRLRPTRDDDVAYVVAAEADPDNALSLAPSPREVQRGDMRDPGHRHLVAAAGGRRVEEGALRGALDDGGRFASQVMMSMLRPEWAAR